MRQKAEENSENSSNYHPFSIPPNLQFCDQHRKCSQFGKIVEQLSEESCPCCNSPPRQTLKLSCKISEIYDVNEPAGYYFTYLKLVIFVLIIVMLITGVYTLVQIVNQCDKQTQQGVCIYIYGIPFPKIHIFFRLVLIILNIVVIVVLYLFSAYLFYKSSYLHEKSKSLHQRAQDYSVLLTGFDHKAIKIDNLRSFLEGCGVKDIIYTHKIKKYLKWLSEKSLLDAQYNKYYRHGNKKAENIKEKIVELENRMLHTKNMLILGQDEQLRTDKVIITFTNTAQKKAFQDQYRLTLWNTIYHTFCGGSPLLINQAPLFIEPLGAPTEIIWENLEVTSKMRYIRIFVSNLISIILLFGSFIMIAFLTKSEEDRSEVGDALMSVVFAVLIQVVNEIISIVIESLTQWQGRYTLTGELSLKLFKNCGSFFLNTTLLPFLLFAINLIRPEQDDIIRNILSIFFISNLISPYIGLYLQPKYLFKLYKRRKISSQGKQCLITQKKANEVFEKIDYMLDERYAIVSQLVLNCMFYAAIFPIGIVITIFGLILTYWSSKWWVLNYCNMPKFSHKLSNHVNQISCFFPTVYAFGYAANLYMVQQQVQFDRTYSLYIAAATVPLTIIFLVFGQSVAKKCLLKRSTSIIEPINKLPYFIDYKNLNPTTFFHQNLLVEAQQPRQDIWSKLVNYVAARETGILIKDFNDYDDRSSRSSKSSKLSLNNSINH